jgi:hypothetical protein
MAQQILDVTRHRRMAGAAKSIQKGETTAKAHAERPQDNVKKATSTISAAIDFLSERQAGLSALVRPNPTQALPDCKTNCKIVNAR